MLHSDPLATTLHPLPIPLFYGFNKFPIPEIQCTADVWSNRNDKTKAVLKYTYNKVYIMQ